MESIWRKTVEIPKRAAMSGDIQVEAAVIGGGMAGILIAHFLQKKGINTVVLEEKCIGSGQTEKTTAKITSSHNLIYHKMVKTQGEDQARQYANANQQAIEEYERIIQEKGIDCGYERCPSYLYSEMEEALLREEVQVASELGLPAEFTTETELPFPIKGAVKFNDQARFHPLAFLKAIAEDLTIYEQTKVERIEESCIWTNQGKVQAQHIVFACHYPFINIPGYYFMRMHQERSYVIAVEDVPAMHGMYLGIDNSGLSFRKNERQILLGGGSHRTGENKFGQRYEQLRVKAKTFWKGSREVAFWSAQDCITLDGIPYIGRFSASKPNWYVATGFGKWGMTSSMVSAMIVSDLITETPNPWETVFSPQRFDLSATAKNMVEDGMQAVKGLTKKVFAIPKTEMEKLPNGHGGVVEYDGEKAGVYKNEEGECFVVPIRCPHLGCQLEWNPDELSWDCPCHGSRFDYRGNRLNGPAQKDLEDD